MSHLVTDLHSSVRRVLGVLEWDILATVEIWVHQSQFHFFCRLCREVPKKPKTFGSKLPLHRILLHTSSALGISHC